MLRVILLLCIVALVGGTGPKFPPTKGEIWPFPEYESKESKLFIVTSDFRVQVSKNHSCPMLERAVERYQKIYIRNPVPEEYQLQINQTISSKILDRLDYLRVVLKQPCEEWPYPGMDEKYRLVVNKRSILTSNSIWGILRGLESFAHLLYISNDYKTVQIRATEIRDSPHYRYRGLMLNTGANYITTSNILKIIAAMSMNKLNVLHWRITQDYSFPYVSDAFPELSKGAFHNKMVYTKEDIARVTEFARDRGIMVIPEIPFPGSSASILVSHPELESNCSMDIGPLDPTKEDTELLARGICQELQDRFHGGLYIGSTNFDFNCWKENKNIMKYMADHHLSAQDLLVKIYQTMFNVLDNKTVPMVWQDLWELNYKIPKHSIVHVYRADGYHDAVKLLKEGYNVVASMMYNMTSPAIDRFHSFYLDPLMMIRLEARNDSLLANFMGAELTPWTPYINDDSVFSILWPSVVGVAEPLWSMTQNLEEPARADLAPAWRAEELACRMRRRGLPVPPPAGPGYCFA